jgi:hypothetical protein
VPPSRALRGLSVFACAAALFAQAPASQPATAGLEPDWDIAPVLQEMGDHAARLLPVLDRIDVKAWIAKGASETYADQLQSSKDQSKALAGGARALSHNPEKLSTSLELFFRIEGLETMLASLEDGIRKYQDPQLARQLAAVNAENGANRERFRGYIINLAAQRENQFEVMDREAQSCRNNLSPTVSPKNLGRKK